MTFGALQTLSFMGTSECRIKKKKKREISKYVYFEYMTIYLDFQKYFCFHNGSAFEGATG